MSWWRVEIIVMGATKLCPSIGLSRVACEHVLSCGCAHQSFAIVAELHFRGLLALMPFMFEGGRKGQRAAVVKAKKRLPGHHLPLELQGDMQIVNAVSQHSIRQKGAPI